MAYINNKVELIGNLTADCEVKSEKVIMFNLAVDKGLDKTMFIGVKVFSDLPKMLDTAEEHLLKGSRVHVVGALDVGTYEKEDGTKVKTVSVIADRVDVVECAILPLKQRTNTNDENPDKEPKKRGGRVKDNDNNE